MSRKPNTGPYIVIFGRTGWGFMSRECHTWEDACYFMRQALIDGYEVSVKFA